MSLDNRRCTASQFFKEEEEEAVNNVPTYDRVVDLLNQASLAPKDSLKVELLRKVKELIVFKEPNLLDNFLDEILAFQSDRSTDVKKAVISFMEDASKADPEHLSRIVMSLQILLLDENPLVVKKVLLSIAQLYKVTLMWLSVAKKSSDSMQLAWQGMQQMKTMACDMVNSDNDGIRTHAIKFIEAVILALSERTSESDTPKVNKKDFTLDQLDAEHPFLKKKKLEEDGKRVFESLLNYMASVHISSINLITCLSSMSMISRQRPQFMQQVVQAFETLHVNLPPTLANSQVSSVRKNLKLQMLSLLKHVCAIPFHPQITTLLTDLGATQNEVLKVLPKDIQNKKRKAEEEAMSMKKPKIEATQVKDEDDDYGATPFIGMSATKVKVKTPEDQKHTAIDVTAEDLVTRLSPQNVADLVLLSMVMLPETMPSQFQATYTPIAAAGTQAQIKHLARLLATQLTAAGLGKGIAEVQIKMSAQEEEPAEEDEDEDDQPSSPKHTIRTVVGGTATGGETPAHQPMPPPTAIPAPPQSSSRKGIRAFRLAAVTKPIEKTKLEDFAASAMKRILSAEHAAQTGDVSHVRTKILSSIVTQFGGKLKDELETFIFADLRNRADLALAWIYQEYANYQNFNVVTSEYDKQTMSSYDNCLTRLLECLLNRPDQREGLFSRLILEAPYITPNAILLLKKYCQDQNRIYLGMTTLKELIVKRPCLKLEFLDVLLEFTSNDKPEVRHNAIRVTKKLHEREDLKGPIEKYALYYVKLLLQPRPPPELYSDGRTSSTEDADGWTEESIKLCLYLYLGLLPINHKLIHELANVYTATTADIKRTILRVLEAPVKGMGMNSPELLLLVENCPKGAETLITRVIHILTDKAIPSPELVDRVRDLYHKRVSDVRFLIPVLTGLSKSEVMFALPKLIKLNPVVVKEVFHRLLGGAPGGGAQEGDVAYSSPLTPAELLIALHNVDHSKCDMRTVIKASQLCFSEKEVYTQEVLALVLQSLMEQNPLPTLLMRTVIQALAMYPKLIGFVMNILQRLVTKQVWKQKKVWEGFIRCCQRTRPHCFQVLLSLPAIQLKSVFETAPEMREPLLTHVQGFTSHQRAHIPKSMMSVLEKDPVEEQRTADRAKREEEERQAAQEQIYQQKLEEERRKQAEKLKQGKSRSSRSSSAGDKENLVTPEVEMKSPPRKSSQERSKRVRSPSVGDKENVVSPDVEMRSPNHKTSQRNGESGEKTVGDEPMEVQAIETRDSSKDSEGPRRSSRNKSSS